MKKKDMNLVMIAGGLALAGGLAYLLLGQQGGAADMGATPTMPHATGNTGYLAKYGLAEVDYTGGLLPWLQKQLSNTPVPDYGVNLVPSTSGVVPTTPGSADFGVSYGPPSITIGETITPWTPAGSGSSTDNGKGGFGVSLGPPSFSTQPVVKYY